MGIIAALLASFLATDEKNTKKKIFLRNGWRSVMNAASILKTVNVKIVEMRIAKIGNIGKSGVLGLNKIIKN